MGCDGGTIPKRDELVRTKKKREQKDKTSELNFRWRCCSISQAPLQKPIVACGLGKLYSKDSVINGLLDRSILPDSAKHLKSLKDVRELNLTPNPGFEVQQEKGDGYVDHQSAPYICPLIGLEMNGKFKFCFPWTCGCVISERAMKELRSPNCQKCQKPVSESDIVLLNASEEDLDLMKVRNEGRQARIKAEKKAKKALLAGIKQEPEETSDTAGPSSSGAVSTQQSSDSPINGTAIKTEPPSERKNGTEAKLKVTSKLISNGVKRPESLGMQAPDLKKAKSDYSVAKDPQASDVFKSIFTSSNKAKEQDRAHWVTYNPFYN